MARKPPPKHTGPGRPKGSKNKRTIAGEVYALDVLVQDETELARDEEGRIKEDLHPRAQTNPVLRQLRAQARNGVGSQLGLLPPNVLLELANRGWGKVLDRVKLDVAKAKAFEAMTDEELAEYAMELGKELALPPTQKPKEAN